jgi:DnaJ-class molecular chaperone
MLRRTFKKLVQGAFHKRNTIIILHLLREAARNQFTEDNEATINAFLEECLKEARKCPRCKGTGQVFIQQGYITIPASCPRCGDSIQKK